MLRKWKNRLKPPRHTSLGAGPRVAAPRDPLRHGKAGGPVAPALPRLLSHWLRLAALVLGVAWLAQHALLGPSGYLALHRRQVQLQQAQAQIQQLEAQNRQLNQNVRALQSNPSAIENIAREQLHLAKPGEVVYTYSTAPNAATSARAAALH